MKRLNCWEFKKCGREPGGANADELGVCAASIDNEMTGVNHGTNGGRICWFVSGTCCQGKIQGTFAQKFHDCHTCEFFIVVQQQESQHFTVTPDLSPERVIISST